ncbi:hypothetical protein BD779DRAFT_1791180 [Infundibulicybe gibba]|nr:hypothetical protein BD779DRAFT_1791180 [Infundibulicybe gibba]
MKYLAIFSALLASQAMGAALILTESKPILGASSIGIQANVLSVITLLGTLNFQVCYSNMDAAFSLRPANTVCCKENASGSASGTGLLSGIISISTSSFVGVCATSCDCVPGSTPA